MGEKHHVGVHEFPARGMVSAGFAIRIVRVCVLFALLQGELGAHFWRFGRGTTSNLSISGCLLLLRFTRW